MEVQESEDSEVHTLLQSHSHSEQFCPLPMRKGKPVRWGPSQEKTSFRGGLGGCRQKLGGLHRPQPSSALQETVQTPSSTSKFVLSLSYNSNSAHDPAHRRVRGGLEDGSHVQIGSPLATAPGTALFPACCSSTLGTRVSDLVTVHSKAHFSQIN